MKIFLVYTESMLQNSIMHAQQNKVITYVVYITHMQDHPDTPLLREALAFVQKVTTAVENLPVVKL